MIAASEEGFHVLYGEGAYPGIDQLINKHIHNIKFSFDLCHWKLCCGSVYLASERIKYCANNEPTDEITLRAFLTHMCLITRENNFSRELFPLDSDSQMIKSKAVNSCFI